VFGNRYRQIFLTVAFLALIYSAGLIEVAVELLEGQTPQVTGLFVQVPTRARLRAFERELEDKCWLAQRLRPYVQSLHFIALRELGDKAIVGRDGWLFYKPAVQYLVEPWSPDPAGDQGDILSAVVSFRDQLAERGIKLLVVPVPNKAGIYPDKLTARADLDDHRVNAKTLEIISRLRQAGVEVVDLFALFRQARHFLGGQGRAAAPLGEGTRYYLAQDSHWSPDGVWLAARAVVKSIIDPGWVEKGHTQYALKSATIQRHGDILKMIQVPQIERQFEPEQIHCTQVINIATNQPYQDDPNSEILVLGDSFLRIYSQDEPGAAGFVEHLAYELGFALASIVNDGGASTLVRQQLSRNPKLLANKKVVVWEFVERDIRFGAEGWQVVHLP